MTSFVERKVNEICGRWLDGFTKDNVDVSLLQAKITLSDLHFKTVSKQHLFEKDQEERTAVQYCRSPEILW